MGREGQARELAVGVLAEDLILLASLHARSLDSFPGPVRRTKQPKTTGMGVVG